MKRIENLFKIAGMKFEFQNLEIRFHVRFRSWSSKTLSANAALILVSRFYCTVTYASVLDAQNGNYHTKCSCV